jgi:regulator of sigma E protease
MEIILIKALQLIISLSILIITHECGHFLFAKIFGVKVEKFYLFFNPWFSLFKYKFKKNGTEFGIGWIPLGGYVKISGMIDESMDLDFLKKKQNSWEFRTKPTWNRLLIIAGGILMNFIFAFFIYSVLAFKEGDNYIPIYKTPLFFSELAHKAGFQDGDIILEADKKSLTRYDDLDLFRVINSKVVIVNRIGKKKKIILPKNFKSQFASDHAVFSDYQSSRIDSLITKGNAKKAGLKIGDKIISINETKINSLNELAFELLKYKNSNVKFGIIRSYKKLKIQVHVDSNGKIGIVSNTHLPIIKNKCTIMQAIPVGFSLGVRKLSFYILNLKLLFNKSCLKNISGLGTVGNLFKGKLDWLNFWSMTAFLSIMLGVMNFLPIPALDGGYIAFIIYEMITGHRPNEKFIILTQIIGMSLILAISIYANGMDIFRFFFKR